MRYLRVCLWLCLALGAAWGLSRPAPAAACSALPATIANFAPFADVVAVGTFVESDTSTAVFEVSTYYKGALDTAQLTVLNHQVANIGADCSTTLGPGNRFAAGTKALLMLSPASETVADWQPAGVMLDGAWPIVNGELTVFNDQTFQPEQLSEAAMEAQLNDLLGAPTPAPAAPAPTVVEEEATSWLPWLLAGLGLAALLGGLVALTQRQRQRK